MSACTFKAILRIVRFILVTQNQYVQSTFVTSLLFEINEAEISVVDCICIQVLHLSYFVLHVVHTKYM